MVDGGCLFVDEGFLFAHGYKMIVVFKFLKRKRSCSEDISTSEVNWSDLCLVCLVALSPI